jgi:hypothetical protein
VGVRFRHSLGLLLTTLLLAGCMTVVLREPVSEIPMSLTGHLRGYRLERTGRYFSQEVWIYYWGGIPNLPMGTREGLRTDHLIEDVVKRHVGPGQGVINLKIRHEKTFANWVATLVSLGIVSPSAVIVEGDVVNLQRLGLQP